MGNSPDIEFWKFLNTFAPWLSGIGSISAVIISICSLYLTIRDRRPKLLIKTYLGCLIHERFNDYVCIYITNCGHRVVTITDIYGEAGSGAYIIPFHPSILQPDEQIQPFPVKLEESEQKIYGFLVKDILVKVTEIKLKPLSQRNIFGIRVVVSISNGKVFKRRYSKNVRKELAKRFWQIRQP